jgi:hypothetical protein
LSFALIAGTNFQSGPKTLAKFAKTALADGLSCSLQESLIIREVVKTNEDRAEHFAYHE